MTGLQKYLPQVFSGLALLALGFAMGRNSHQPSLAGLSNQVEFQNVQNPLPQDTPQELIPLSPAPGKQPGQQQGQKPGQQNTDCPILILKDGKLYQMRPGQNNGNGSQSGQGGSQELIPLSPYQGPAIPGLPAPTPITPQPSDPNNPTPSDSEGQRS